MNTSTPSSSMRRALIFLIMLAVLGVAGTQNYISVTIIQAAALAAESNAINLQLRRLNATVVLIKALGGDW
mgnify:CR=1 FL=1